MGNKQRDVAHAEAARVAAEYVLGFTSNRLVWVTRADLAQFGGSMKGESHHLVLRHYVVVLRVFRPELGDYHIVSRYERAYSADDAVTQAKVNEHSGVVHAVLGLRAAGEEPMWEERRDYAGLR